MHVASLHLHLYFQWRNSKIGCLYVFLPIQPFYLNLFATKEGRANKTKLQRNETSVDFMEKCNFIRLKKFV